MIYFKVLKHMHNHLNFQLQTINELDKLYTKTDMYIYYFRIPHNTFCLFSNLHKFLLSKALQEIFNPPNSLCRNGGKQCIMGNSNHSILCIYTNEFLLKMNQNKSSLSEAEPAITCNRKFTQSTLTSTKRNNSSILSLSTGK